jgi:hypothetical protein
MRNDGVPDDGLEGLRVGVSPFAGLTVGHHDAGVGNLPRRSRHRGRPRRSPLRPRTSPSLSASTIFADTLMSFSALPPPTEKHQHGILVARMRLPLQPVRRRPSCQPSSLTRAVSSETLSVGVHRPRCQHSLRKSLTACLGVAGAAADAEYEQSSTAAAHAVQDLDHFVDRNTINLIDDRFYFVEISVDVIFVF